LGLLSPGTGIIVALTKSKGHWLDIDFHEQDVAKTVVLRLEKRDYQKVCDAAKAHTGKEVALLGRTTTNQGQDQELTVIWALGCKCKRRTPFRRRAP
jgi:hypothetical protein